MIKSTMSEARRREIYEDVVAAMKAGDMERADQLIMQVPLELPLARVLKADWGMERLKSAGFDLSDAVAAYGEGWLNS